MKLPTTIHFANILKKVVKRELRKLTQREHDIIAADADHDHIESRAFRNYVCAEALRIYEDSEHYLNDPSTFKCDPVNN